MAKYLDELCFITQRIFIFEFHSIVMFCIVATDTIDIYQLFPESFLYDSFGFMSMELNVLWFAQIKSCLRIEKPALKIYDMVFAATRRL